MDSGSAVVARLKMPPPNPVFALPAIAVAVLPLIEPPLVVILAPAARRFTLAMPAPLVAVFPVIAVFWIVTLPWSEALPVL